MLATSWIFEAIFFMVYITYYLKNICSSLRLHIIMQRVLAGGTLLHYIGTIVALLSYVGGNAP
jgi:hypothetical protein